MEMEPSVRTPSTSRANSVTKSAEGLGVNRSSVLDKLHGDEVLNVENADGPSVLVDHGDLVLPELTDHADGVADQCSAPEGARGAGHDLGDGAVQFGGVAEHQ